MTFKITLLLIWVLGSMAPVWAVDKAADKVTEKTIDKASYVFAVSEGGTSKTAPKDINERYRELALDMGRLLKKPVSVEAVADYGLLIAGLKAARYDIAYIHPAHLAMQAIHRKNYVSLAATKEYENYTVSFFTNADSPIKTLADLKKTTVRDKVLVAPISHSITSAVARHILMAQLGSLPPITYTSQEDALPFTSDTGSAELDAMVFMVKNGLGAYGVSASTAVVNDWKAEGGRILATSPAIPVKHLIASTAIPEAERSKLIAFFTGLHKTESGRKSLQRIGYAGFYALDAATLSKLDQWFGQ